MLKAIDKFKEEIRTKLKEIWVDQDPRYKFLFCSSFLNKIDFSEDDGWGEVSRAIVGPDGRLVGYFSYQIDRDNNSVKGITLVNFEPNNPLTMFNFIQHFKKLALMGHIQKISWRVTIGNPAEEIYDKIVKRYGARVVGIKLREDRLWDGNLYDVKLYELLTGD